MAQKSFGSAFPSPFASDAPRPAPGFNPFIATGKPQAAMADWLTLVSSPNFKRLQPPQRCQSQSDKVRNLENFISTIESTHREMMTANDKLQFANRAILVLGLVRDTCVGFLDLAASMIPNKAAQDVAKMGSTAISAADSVGEVLGGDIDPARLALRTADNINNLVKPTTIAGQLAQLKVQQFTNLAPGVLAGTRGDQAKARAEMQKGTINTLFDTVSTSVNTASTSSTDSYARIVRGLGIAKAAYNYNIAVAARLDTYLNDQTNARMDRQQWERDHKMQMRRLYDALKSAQGELDVCMKR